MSNRTYLEQVTMVLRMDKKRTLLLAGAMGVALFSLLMVPPLWRAFSQEGKDIQILRDEMAAAREAMRWQGEFQRAGRLLTRKDISRAMDEITKTASAFDVVVLSTVPQPIVARPGSAYPVLPIRIEMLSEYKDLGLFLGAVEGLQQSIATVQSFRVAPKDADSSRVRTELVIDLYLRKGEDG